VSIRPRLVVIGNGMAAARTLEHLLQIAPQHFDITVFGAEPHGSYNRILLSPVLAGEMEAEAIVLRDAAWYDANGIALRMGRRVIAIDRVRRRVQADDGTFSRYDRLLIATGSDPVRLPIPGADLDGVLTYRDLADTERLIAASALHRRAVVIGGGLLGLEAANGLRARGMEVDVVHLMDCLMERQLDADGAAVLQARLEKRGLRFHLGMRTVRILGKERVNAVEIENANSPSPALPQGGGSKTIATDLVVVAVGVRPNVTLARECGLRVERGIVVDDTLQTYDPRIYAVGECVQHRGMSYGLVQPGYEMARIAAAHLAAAGIHSYRGSTSSTHLKVTGIDVFSAGELAPKAAHDSIVLRDPARGIYRRLVIEGDRLVGGVLVGDSAGAGRYTELIRSRASVAAMRGELMFLQ
jgi:nitrite reductase (NADH) large subunit